jgi:hypothetical protein
MVNIGYSEGSLAKPTFTRMGSFVKEFSANHPGLIIKDRLELLIMKNLRNGLQPLFECRYLS